jgi:hypothetical protein
MLRHLAAVLVILAGCACGAGGVTDVALPVAEAASPEPAASPTVPASPTPAPGPTYWRAWYEGAELVHENLGGHYQNVRECAYRESGAGMVRLWTKGVLAGPGETVRVALPSAAYTGEWCSTGEIVIVLRLFGLVGPDRACPANPAQLGNITARTRVAWGC